MKIAIYGVESFVGCNISNYAIQHTKHSILGMATRSWNHRIPHLEPSIQSKTRFSLQWGLDQDAITERMKFEAVDAIVFARRPDPITESMMRHASSNKEAVFTYKGGEPVVFGPRETGDSWFAQAADAILDNGVRPHPWSMAEHGWIYIKDYYERVMSVLEGGTFDTNVHLAKQSDILDIMEAIVQGKRPEWNSNKALSSGLVEAIEHTMVWRNSNRWIREIK